METRDGAWMSGNANEFQRGGWREGKNQRSLNFQGNQVREPWQGWKCQHGPLKKQAHGITVTRDKWIKGTERSRGNDREKKKIGGGMTDRGIRRGAGRTWRLEDSGLFEKQRLRVQVPTMWLWPSVMQISPLRHRSPECCPSPCLCDSQRDYPISPSPVKSFTLVDQRECVCVGGRGVFVSLLPQVCSRDETRLVSLLLFVSVAFHLNMWSKALTRLCCLFLLTCALLFCLRRPHRFIGTV